MDYKIVLSDIRCPRCKTIYIKYVDHFYQRKQFEPGPVPENEFELKGVFYCTKCNTLFEVIKEDEGGS